MDRSSRPFYKLRNIVLFARITFKTNFTFFYKKKDFKMNYTSFWLYFDVSD